MRDTTHPTREAWLLAAIDAMRPDFADAGLSLVAGIRVSCGFPSRPAVAARSRRIGECWRPEAAADGIPQILISPLLADPVEVLGVLRHELIHASGIYNHAKGFAKAAVKLGLVLPAKATTVGEGLRAHLADMAQSIGAYPHAALTPGNVTKKQTTRMLKVECPECGYTVRTTARWIAEGLPICPCGAGMVCV